MIVFKQEMDINFKKGIIKYNYSKHIRKGANLSVHKEDVTWKENFLCGIR